MTRPHVAAEVQPAHATTTATGVVPWVLVGLTSASGFLLMGLRELVLGWTLLVLTLVLTLLVRHPIRRHLPLVLFSLALLGITPISTDISYGHMLTMGLTLSLAVAVPYVVSARIYRDGVIRIPVHHGRRWTKAQLGYVLLAGVIAYFLLPFYLRDTGSYLNWDVDPGVGNLTRLFIGTNALGLWDELFFVITALAVFRRYLPFWAANLAQAVLFTSFLHELGFHGWGPLAIFPFALLQGYIFKRTDSLLYIVAIHLTIDFVLYLALIHAHHPDWMPIFVIT